MLAGRVERHDAAGAAEEVFGAERLQLFGVCHHAGALALDALGGGSGALGSFLIGLPAEPS